MFDADVSMVAHRILLHLINLDSGRNSEQVSTVRSHTTPVSINGYTFVETMYRYEQELFLDDNGEDTNHVKAEVSASVYSGGLQQLGFA